MILNFLSHSLDGNEEPVPPPTIEEVTTCVKKISKGKAFGPDEIPIEQYQSSDIDCKELHSLIVSIFETEEVPEDKNVSVCESGYFLTDVMKTVKKYCTQQWKIIHIFNLLSIVYHHS